MNLKGTEGALSLENPAQMNRVLRHKLRNHSAGMKMTIAKIQSILEDVAPNMSDRCSLMIEELSGLEVFSTRMDYIFNDLPAPEAVDFFTLLHESRSFFVQKFSFCDLKMSGPQSVFNLKYGNWLIIAVKELLANSGECVGENNLVEFSWSVDEALTLEFSNSGDPIPNDIPLDPPQAFFTHKGRHDGLGLAIVYRICSVLGGTINFKNENDRIKVQIQVPLKEITNA